MYWYRSRPRRCWQRLAHRLLGQRDLLRRGLVPALRGVLLPHRGAALVLGCVVVLRVGLVADELPGRLHVGLVERGSWN